MTHEQDEFPAAKYPLSMLVNLDIIKRMRNIKRHDRTFTSPRILEIGLIAIESRWAEKGVIINPQIPKESSEGQNFRDAVDGPKQQQ